MGLHRVRGSSAAGRRRKRNNPRGDEQCWRLWEALFRAIGNRLPRWLARETYGGTSGGCCDMTLSPFATEANEAVLTA